jgi:tol-pal system protein YbgF
VLIGALAPFSIASAQLFPDNEARKAVNELRDRVNGVDQRLDRIEQQSNRTSGNQVDAANQMDALRQDIANLRGSIEVMQKSLADSQKRQQDFYADLDARLKKTEPQTMNIDGQDVPVDQDQLKAWNAAFELFRNSQFAPASTAFTQFISSYPQSPYTPQARFWLGNSLYASRDFKGAISAEQAFIKAFPDNPRVPDAMMTIGNSQLELGDKVGARKSFRDVTEKFASSNAAQSAKERLATLK